MAELGKRSSDHEIVKLDDIQHALHAADFYIGQAVGTQSPEVSRFVYNQATKLMEYRTVQYPHGLLKIFDEALVNAADNHHRGTTLIRVGISVLHNSIYIYNDGPNFAIRLSEHDSRWDVTKKAYQPEVAFFHCKTSSSYGKKNRVTGGKFGLGAKLIAIFSSWCTVEMCDGEMYYYQKSSEHMTVIHAPTVKKCKPNEKPYLAICFSPDLRLFYPEASTPSKLDDVVLDLFMTRALDIAGTVPKTVKVYWTLNRHQFLAPKACTFERLSVKGFKDYVHLFVPDVEKVAYYECPRWEVCMIQNPYSFPVHVSFVNGINTYMGGEHLKYIQNQLFQFMKTKVEGIDARRVQQSVMVFVNATIEDASFTSQCKELLQTLPSQFGSVCMLPEKFFNRNIFSGVLEMLKSNMESKDLAVARREIGASKSRPVHDIPNLRDARFAGTRNAHKCTIYIVEGVSALALAEVGLSVMGSDYYGAFPVKGKLINADKSVNRLKNNAEFVSLCRVLGLDIGKEVQRSQLRYGRVVILTDADPDGSHIRGLLVYMFVKFWPNLLQETGFLEFMITPIVVAKSKRQKTLIHYFYTLPSFLAWSEQQQMNQWEIKYYKGLATSTTAEGRYYFANLRHHLRTFSPAKDDDTNALAMVFDQKKKDASTKRKDWLKSYDAARCIEYDHIKQVTIKQFVNDDLIHFSWLSVCRALPMCEDGLTPAARKCLWTFLQRNIVKDQKVCTLQSYVDENTHYHHGADSLGQTIIRMAQTFVGAQNINLFHPSGQFGTRVDGGDKTVGATRYIFSRLSGLTRSIFHADDDAILALQTDEGHTIEPVCMYPIIPMLLVNGANQVGTAYACKIACYQPETLIAAIERMLDGQPWQELTPWYHQFKGTIMGDAYGNFTSRGLVEKISPTVWHITELPIRVWREVYKTRLSKMVVEEQIAEFYEKHTNNDICFEVRLKNAPPDDFDPYTFFHLQNKFSSNMNVFTKSGNNIKIESYKTVQALFTHWFHQRLPIYEERRKNVFTQIEREIPFLQGKVKFIRVIIDGAMKLGRKRQVMSAELCAEHNIPEEFHSRLFQMDMNSLSEERVLKIEKDLLDAQCRLQYYDTIKPSELWRQDLAILKNALANFWDERVLVE